MRTPLAQAIADNEGYRAVFAAPTTASPNDNPQTHLLGLLGRIG